MRTFLERINQEKETFPRINPELVEREKISQDGYVVRVASKLNRPITDEEWIYLSNII